MTRASRYIAALAVVAILALAGIATWQTVGPGAPAPPGAQPAVLSGPVRGGSLVGSIRAEPRTFNRYAGFDFTTEVITHLTQAKLVRVNRLTGELEPWLAEGWDKVDPAGLTYKIRLRPGLTFSDGTPFTSADVLFAFKAVFDEGTRSPLGDSLRVGGKPLQVSAPDPSFVYIAFPSAFGPGLRLLDNLPILPRHKLEPALAKGRLAEAWGPTTPPAEIVGLGPFVVQEYRPGERLVFARNPRYWRRDASGVQLPYLDRLTLEIVPDPNAELLRLQAGQLDLTQTELRAEDYLPVKRAADAGRLRLMDLGVGLDTDAFWFNLKPEAKARDPRRPWLQSRELRQAVSLAVDRKAYADTVFLGAAAPVHGPITPGNRPWYSPELPGGEHDPARARKLLAGLRLMDRNGDGLLEDAATGSPARLAVLVQRGSPRERGAAFIREELRKVGLELDVVGLEVGAVMQRWQKGDYDAIYHSLVPTDHDPASNLDFWLSSGSAHVWNPSQPRPATDWERQIDELMLRQAGTFNERERVQLFDHVQRIFADHQPALYFAAPRIYVATGPRVAHTTPARLRPQLLWNAEALAAVKTSAATN